MTPTRWSTTGEAEHAVLGLTAVHPSASALTVATHFSGGGVVVTSQVGDEPVRVHRPDDIDDIDDIDDRAGQVAPPSGQADEDDRLVALHGDRQGGRLVVFPGSDAVMTATTVGDVLTGSAIEAVVVLGRPGVASSAAAFDPQGFVRPHFEQGQVVLAARPAAGGLLVPFEQANPTPCCADH